VGVGRGWSFADASINASRAFGLLGPFSRGDIIERLEVFVNTAGATELDFAASLGFSESATLEAFLAGASLVDRGTLHGSGRPAVVFANMPAGFSSFIVAIGRRVEVGAAFIVLMMESTVAATNTSWLVTVFVEGRSEHSRELPRPL